jgi:branched-subunit amino acid aminotransferase/4-amino-4-deoxychorismate lyase
MELIKALNNGATIKALRSFTDNGVDYERFFNRNSKYVLEGRIGNVLVLRNTRTDETFPLNPAILTSENFGVINA